MRRDNVLNCLLVILTFLPLTPILKADGLEPLKYHNPGLIVDLGVGLWAWPIPCDADGDGDYDLIVSCPDKPSNGVWFFENVTGDTSVNPMPVFKAARRLSSTHRYVMPSYVDGELRVLTPGFEYPDFEKTGLKHKVSLKFSADRYKPQWKQPKGPKLRHDQWRYVDYDGDGALDLVVGIEDWSDYGWDDAWNAKGEWTNGPLHGFVLLYRNSGTTESPHYEPYVFVEADGKPVDTFGCPSPNFTDFDHDGDLDLLCGEFVDGFTYFENIGTRTAPNYAAGQRLHQKNGQLLTMNLEMIVPIAFDWDQDGDADLIVGDEDGRVAFIENVGPLPHSQSTSSTSDSNSPNGPPVFASPRYFQQVADTLKCGALATPVGVDWDGDGDTDIVSGNTAGYFEFFENLSGAGIAEPVWAAPVRLKVDGQEFRIMAGPNGSIQGPCEAKWGYTTFSVADWDNDGLPDIVFNSILGRVQWLKNIGTRKAPRLAPPQAIEVQWDGPTPKPAWNWWNPAGKELVTQWRTTPVVYDFTDDGLPDLAMLDVEGYFVLFERTRENGELELLPPQRVFTNSNGKPLRFNSRTAGRSGRRKIAVTDWDGDGQFDLLLNSSNADLYRGLGKQNGQWRFEHVGALAKKNIEGHDVSPTTVDFDGNGIPDFLGGAEDGRFYFMQNPRQALAAAEVPDDSPAGFMKSEWIFESAPFPSCHASTIVETTRGKLISAWFGGTAEKNPDVGIWVSRHVEGKWTPPVEVANGIQDDTSRWPCWNPVLFQPGQGKLMLFYKVGPSPSEWWGMLRRSTDDGATWSEAKRLPDGFLGPVKNKPVQLVDGTILCGSSTEGLSPRPEWQVHFERTNADGDTWEMINVPVNAKSPDAIQPSILDHGKGHLQAIGRTRSGKIFTTSSLDDGKTWNQLSLLSLPNPNSGTDAVTIADGRHLLVYNHQTKGRSPLNLAVSKDGIHWDAALVFESDPGEYSYPAIIQTHDGLVHVTYTWNRKRIKHVVLDPGKLVTQPIIDGKWPDDIE